MERTPLTAFSALRLESIRPNQDGSALFDFRLDDHVQVVLFLDNPGAGLAELRLNPGKRYIVSFREMAD